MPQTNLEKENDSKETEAAAADLRFNTPKSCSDIVEPFDFNWHGNVKARIAADWNEYNQPDPNSTPEERRAKFNRKALEAYSDFVQKRTLEYERTRCIYEGADWNRSGKSTAHLDCQAGFYFLKETLQSIRGSAGDLKGEQWIPETYPTEYAWVTGGHSPSSVRSVAEAKYHPQFISTSLKNELKTIQSSLNTLNIPTQLPAPYDKDI